jgi:RNA polymerase sigma-70 factor, ECF subfamily
VFSAWNFRAASGVYVRDRTKVAEPIVPIQRRVAKNCFWRTRGWEKTYNNRVSAMKVMAGATTLGDLASAIGIRAQEAAVVAELKAGSESAYVWLIGEFHQPIYSLVYRIVSDSADAADTTQEVFLKVFRGMKHFHGESSLKTWIYRIAIHEAANRRRWWFRHKAREVSMEVPLGEAGAETTLGIRDSLADPGESPFDDLAHEEVRARVEEELRKLPEPYRTTVVLRDLEGMSYEEIAEIAQVSLGTVKSRLTRGREALKQRLIPYVREVGSKIGLEVPEETGFVESRFQAAGGEQVEVTP